MNKHPGNLRNDSRAWIEVPADDNGDAMIAWEFGSLVYGSERRGGVWRHPILGVSQPFNPVGGSTGDSPGCRAR